MWIAARSFHYRDKHYAKGVRVPAETWPGRNQLIKLHRLKWVPEVEPEAEPPNPKTMKRAELNEYAAEQGVKNPEKLKSIAEVLQALEDLKNGGSEGDSTPSTDKDNDGQPDDPNEPPTSEPDLAPNEPGNLSEEDDDLFKESEDEIEVDQS